MEPFHFKQFSVSHQESGFKIGTDSVLLGAITPIKNTARALDVGTGCGVIALMLLQRGVPSVTGVEIDRAAAKEAKLNVESSKWSNRAEILCGDFRDEDFVKGLGLFDLVVSNPPFFSQALKPFDPKKSLARHSDYALPFNILMKSVAAVLSERGVFSVILPDTESENVIMEAQKNDLFPDEVHHIFSIPGRLLRRIFVFGKQREDFVKEHKFVIRNRDHTYSREYINLTRDFYSKEIKS